MDFDRLKRNVSEIVSVVNSGQGLTLIFVFFQICGSLLVGRRLSIDFSIRIILRIKLNLLRGFLAELLVYKRQGQIQAGGNPGRTPDIAVVDETFLDNVNVAQRTAVFWGNVPPFLTRGEVDLVQAITDRTAVIAWTRSALDHTAKAHLPAPGNLATRPFPHDKPRDFPR